MKADTVLRRAPHLRVQVDADNSLVIYASRGPVECGYHGLAILDVFREPVTFGYAVKQLEAHTAGAVDWMHLTADITRLYKQGVLLGEEDPVPEASPSSKNFDTPVFHVDMLNDRQRTDAFLQAIHQSVSPGDVVVDIGTGSGVLAIAAAQAGARHVYAIEATTIGVVAQAMFEANGLADRITLIQDWSTQVRLPERADVVTSEIIGNDPLDERVLTTLADATHRFLKPDGRMIPAQMRIYGLAVTVPTDLYERSVASTEMLDAWQVWYGIDFGPLAAAVNAAAYPIFVRPHKPRDWPVLAEPVALAELDLTQLADLAIDRTVDVEVTTPGELSGIVLYFELQLNEKVILSRHPSQVDEWNSWRSPVWIMPTPLSLAHGDIFRLTYRFGLDGNFTQITVTSGR